MSGRLDICLIEVALATGARRGELLALEWTDIDWIGRAVTISKSLEQTGAGLRVKSTKSNKPRPCTLPAAAVAALQFHREQQQDFWRKISVSGPKNNLVFIDPDGDFLAPDLVSQVVIRRLRKARIASGSMHSLRHTHASNLLSRGVPLPAVSARLGHADPNITARIYSHALPADDHRAADTWDAVIGSDDQAMTHGAETGRNEMKRTEENERKIN